MEKLSFSSILFFSISLIDSLSLQLSFCEEFQWRESLDGDAMAWSSCEQDKVFLLHHGLVKQKQTIRSILTTY